MMTTNADRITGCIIGAALGDALGAPNEFTNRQLTREELLADYTGQWTDDTQLSMLVVETHALKRFNSYSVALAYWAEHPHGGKHHAPGTACLAAANYYRTTRGAYNNTRALGSGAIMRSHVYGCLYPGLSECLDWCQRDGETSHGYNAMPPTIAFATIVHSFIYHPERSSYLLQDPYTKYVAHMSKAESKACLFSEEGGWTSGGAFRILLESFKGVALDPEAALYKAAGHPGDSDTIGSIVGAVIGAHYGYKHLHDMFRHLIEGLVDLPWLMSNAQATIRYKNGG